MYFPYIRIAALSLLALAILLVPAYETCAEDPSQIDPAVAEAWQRALADAAGQTSLVTSQLAIAHEGSQVPPTMGSIPQVPADPLSQLASRAIAATSVLLGACVLILAIVKWRSDRTVQSGGRPQLDVLDTLRLSPKVSVQLVRVGSQRVMVGHDATGLRTMVVLPETFASRFDEVADAPTANEPTKREWGHFENPKDLGWDLNRPIS